MKVEGELWTWTELEMHTLIGRGTLQKWIRVARFPPPERKRLEDVTCRHQTNTWKIKDVDSWMEANKNLVNKTKKLLRPTLRTLNSPLIVGLPIGNSNAG